MGGQAHDGKEHTLKIGDPCIIEVSPSNYPEGLWWGSVTAVGEFSERGRVMAVITGGRFAVDHLSLTYMDPIRSTENLDRVPSENYHVYPDTISIRRLLHRQLVLENSVKELKGRFDHLRNDLAQVLTTTIQNLKRSEI